MNATELASELARRCQDSPKDDGLDMDIAQANHAVKVLRQLCAENPAGVWVALGNERVCETCGTILQGDRE
jgi:predicted secreted protein